MSNEGYLISELARRAKVSVRTIRYYISEGLLPSPEGHGRYSVYDEEYLDRIELIKRLKDAFLPLKEIRRQLETLSKEEIAELLRQPQAPAGAMNESAGGVEGEETGDAVRQAALPAPSQAPAAAQAKIRDGGLPNALDYIAGVLKTRPLERIHQAPPAPPVSRMPMRSATNTSAGVQAGDAPTGTRWTRIVILPGLELHASEETSRRLGGCIQEWVKMIEQSAREELAGGKNV
jgi:DNA-binding transcriptional MerR regulator